MRSPLHLVTVASFALTCVTSGIAQLHSPQVTLHRTDKPEDLSWLWNFASPLPLGDENAFARDPRFLPFLKRNLTAPQSFWGERKPLAEVAADFLGGPPGAVLNEDNRYFIADACVQHFCPDRGLLWVDLGLPRPLIVFSAVDWISDNKTSDDPAAAYTMWVFSNRALAIDHIPPALSRSIARWTAQPSSGSTELQNITRVFVIDPDGTPHPVSPNTLGAHNTLPAETSSDMKVQP